MSLWVPKSIIIDQDVIFMALFWREFFKLYCNINK